MSLAMRIFWLSALVCFAAGCTSSRSVSVPGLETDATAADQLARGDRVRVMLVGGETITGRVSAISPEALTLAVPAAKEEDAPVSDPRAQSTRVRDEYEAKRTAAPETRPRVIPIGTILGVEKTSVSAVKTSGMVVLILAGIVAIGLATFEFDYSN